jgi:hypothetical protein
MGSNGSDWLSRVTIPDMYPRVQDPYRPRQGGNGPVVADPSDEGVNADPVTVTLTMPGQRPVVSQRAVNYGFTAGTASLPLTAARLEIDGFMVNVPSTAANSVWLGFGSSITVGTGLEVQAGVPVFFSASNDRQEWELQRALEYMAAVAALQNGLQPLPAYRAPRVVLNAADWFIIASAATNISLMFFFIPEQQ